MRDPSSAFNLVNRRLRPVMQQSIFEPGMIVKHPQKEDWGLGQVQSAVGGKVTVNFQNAGKVVIEENKVSLTVVSFG